jgi:hypothetical protein
MMRPDEEDQLMPQMPADPPEAPEAEDMGEAGEPPEDTPADATEDRAEGEDPNEEMQGDAEGGAALAKQSRQALEARIPPQLQSAVERLVLAGTKVMFSPQTHELALSQIQDAKDPARGAATGVAALMSQLVSRTKGALPQPAIPPAANILLMEALAFMDESGQVDLTADMIASATEDLTAYLMQKLGLTPEAVDQAHQVMRAGPAGQTPANNPPPPAAGLVGQAMEG